MIEYCEVVRGSQIGGDIDGLCEQRRGEEIAYRRLPSLRQSWEY